MFPPPLILASFSIPHYRISFSKTKHCFFLITWYPIALTNQSLVVVRQIYYNKPWLTGRFTVKKVGAPSFRWKYAFFPLHSWSTFCSSIILFSVTSHENVWAISLVYLWQFSCKHNILSGSYPTVFGWWRLCGRIAEAFTHLDLVFIHTLNLSVYFLSSIWCRALSVRKTITVCGTKLLIYRIKLFVNCHISLKFR